MVDGKDNSFVDGTAEKNIRPGFLGGSGGGETPVGLRTDGKAKPGEGAAGDTESKAVQDLRSAEDEAKKAPEESDGSIDSTRQTEQKAGGLYTGASKAYAKTGNKRSRFSAKGKKKVGPISLIIIALFGFGGAIAGAQFFQPFSLLAQFQEMFSSMQVSAHKRSGRFLVYQLDTNRVKNPIKTSIFGSKFKISNKMADELAKQGIGVNREFDLDGKKITVLEFVDGDGKKHIVTANSDTADKIKAKGYSAMDFKTAREGNVVFKTNFDKGAKTWQGKIAGWFGEGTKKFLKANKIERNTFKDYKDKGDNEKNKTEVQDVLNKKTDSIVDEGVKTVPDEKEDTDDGPVLKHSDDPEKETLSRKAMNAEAVKTKLGKIGGKFTNVANVGCAITGVIGAINLLVVASEASQIMALTSAYFETYDKAKAGYGSSAPVGVLTAALNEQKTNKNVIVDGELDGTGVTNDGVGGLYTTEVSTKKSAMESAGIISAYSGTAVNPNDPSVQSFNIIASSKKILNGLKIGDASLSMDLFKDCAIAKMGAAVVSAGVGVASASACIVGLVGAAFSFGASAAACFPLLIETVAKAAIGVGIGVVVGGVIALIAPMVASSMTRNLIDELGGEDLGNALTFGANMYMGGAHRANGGSLATVEKYQQFAISKQQVIAEDAENERASLSPFDLTSKYTFMGTIMTQLMSYMTSNSLMSTLTSTSSIVSKSALATVEPNAMAYNVVETLPDMEEYAETCPYLASIGAVGDAYCNPYIATDTSTMDYDPAYNVIDTLAEAGNFEDENTSDDNVKIKPDSDLAKYIIYCDQRESAFGVADQNIAAEIGDFGVVSTNNSLVNNAGNGLLGSTVIGDAIEIIDDADQLANLGYISGESCVAGNNVENTEAPNWNTAKYYQRFIEDQALAESMGVIKKSAVAAFVEDYYEKNPLDNSYEGILARKTGMTKDDVIALLEIVDYYDYIAHYDAGERYAFGEDNLDIEKKIIFDDKNVLAGDVVMPNQIEYRDIRNRSFAV